MTVVELAWISPKNIMENREVMMADEPTAMECSNTTAEEEEDEDHLLHCRYGASSSSPLPPAFDAHAHALANDDGGGDGDDDENRITPVDHNQHLLQHNEDAENQHMISPPPPPPFAVADRVFCRDYNNDNNNNNNNTAPTTDSHRLHPAVIRKVRWNAAPPPPTPEGSSGIVGGGGVLVGNGCWEFLVHYSGWNARWDRWRQAHELVPDVPPEREKYRLQQEQREQEQRGVASQSDAGAAAAAAAASRKRKGRDAAPGSSPTEADPTQAGGNVLLRSSNRNLKQRIHRSANPLSSQQRSLPLAAYCELPLSLKTVLVEEWERMSRRGWNSPHGRDPPPPPLSEVSGGDSSAVGLHRPDHPARAVHHLPAKVTVKQVLQHFGKSRPQPPSDFPPPPSSTSSVAATATPAQVQEFCRGLLELFEAALPTCLLYPQERPQYRAIRAEHTSKAASELYGCEYLLRLLVRLPALLQAEGREGASTPFSGRRAFVGPLLADLVALLQKNRQALFQPHKSPYRHPHPPEYLDWEREAYGSASGPSS